MKRGIIRISLYIYIRKLKYLKELKSTCPFELSVQISDELLVLLRDGELNPFRVHAEVEEFHFLDLDVQVAQPLVDVSAVLLLDVFEFVRRVVGFPNQHRDFELALID